MAKKLTVDKLAGAIEEILEKYEGDIQNNLQEAVKAVTRAGVKSLKAESRDKFNGTGKYAAGWTSTMETGRMSAQGVIYNVKTPGLPHLLEYGHANRGGGRTPGKAHIKPVEETLISIFEKELTDGI